MFHVHSSWITNMKNITRHNTFILKCFILFKCTNLDDSQKEGGNFFNLLQKEGVTRKGGGVHSEKGRFQSNTFQNYTLFF